MIATPNRPKCDATLMRCCLELTHAHAASTSYSLIHTCSLYWSFIYLTDTKAIYSAWISSGYLFTCILNAISNVVWARFWINLLLLLLLSPRNIRKTSLCVFSFFGQPCLRALLVLSGRTSFPRSPCFARAQTRQQHGCRQQYGVAEECERSDLRLLRSSVWQRRGRRTSDTRICRRGAEVRTTARITK